jgi:DNA-binding NtrC family response regulator
MNRANVRQGSDRPSACNQISVLLMQLEGRTPETLSESLDDVGLAGLPLHVIPCGTVDEFGRAMEGHRPVAGLLYFGRQITEAAMEITARLSETLPRLRLIALIEPDAAQSKALGSLINDGFIFDFHTLPIDRERLAFLLGHVGGLVALEKRADRSNVFPHLTDGKGMHLVGSSPPIREVFAAIRKFAAVDAPVLITGETGTGKELAAQAIHDRSSFSNGPFISINCAGLPTGIIESELFGYERGAFTGALKQKIGRIEAAGGGTLFLDEIGDLPLTVQGHLLRFLQHKTIERLGATRSIRVDCRVVAATNVNLEDSIAAGRFREDLFYRLNVLTIHMPPLRERGDDIELLATYFLRKISTELKMPKVGFHDAALRKIQRHRWPGNVRELISTIRRVVVMADGRWIKAQHLNFRETGGPGRTTIPDLATARQELEKKLMREALRMNASNIKRAAEELGVSRVTFYRMMEKYSIVPSAPSGGSGRSRRMGRPVRRDSADPAGQSTASAS